MIQQTRSHLLAPPCQTEWLRELHRATLVLRTFSDDRSAGSNSNLNLRISIGELQTWELRYGSGCGKRGGRRNRPETHRRSTDRVHPTFFANFAWGRARVSTVPHRTLRRPKPRCSLWRRSNVRGDQWQGHPKFNGLRSMSFAPMSRCFSADPTVALAHVLQAYPFLRPFGPHRSFW